MTTFFIYLFFLIGIAAASFFIVNIVIETMEKRSEQARERKDQFMRIIATLDRIESNTRNKPNQG